MAAGEPDLYAAEGPVGVVVIHEVFGRDEYVGSVGRALATAGFAAATVDLYHGRHAGTLDEALALRGALDEGTVLSQLDAAGAALRSMPRPPTRVGLLGFCMGGGFALLGACRRPFDFAVDYYGRIDRAEEIDGAVGPVLLLLASEDERVTPWAFSELLPAARKSKKRVTVELYPGVRHAFHRPGWEGHDPSAARDAWSRTLGFLREQQPGGGSGRSGRDGPRRSARQSVRHGHRS
ncbi:MAG: dienelactone hydrolase family protein [Thermoplasmata archaeon]